MANRIQMKPITMALGLTAMLGACKGGNEGDTNKLDTVEQAVTGYNSISYNSISYNSISYNSISYNSISYNGLGATSGLGTGTLGFKGIGFTGSGWTDSAWGGSATPVDCTLANNDNSCTTVHNMVNHSDFNGNGIYDNDDKMQALAVLSYWVNCACPAGTTIPFTDTHGSVSTAFYGGLGLAPKWCGSDTMADVPPSELEIVSACLLARTNSKGKHYPLSLRSTEPGTHYTTNERWVSSRAMAVYFGNLWKTPHADNDTTTLPDPLHLDTSGGPWWNKERFSASLYTDSDGSVNLGAIISDQYAYGRDCEVSDCGGTVEYLGGITDTSNNTYIGTHQKQLSSTAFDSTTGVSYPLAVPAAAPGLDIPGGLMAYSDSSKYAGGGSGWWGVHYRGNSWHGMWVYAPLSIPLENPYPRASPPPYLSMLPVLAWTQLESGSIPPAQSVACYNLSQCDAIYQHLPAKLLGLTSSQTVSVNLTGNTNGGGFIGGDPNEAMTLAIRYSRTGMLGDGQCDVNRGCDNTSGFANTLAIECASGQVSPTAGCVGGSGSPGFLKITANIATGSNSLAIVHGVSSPYGKNIFPATFPQTLATNPDNYHTANSDDYYSTAYIYPVYMKDTGGTINPPNNVNPGINTLRAFLTGETSNTSDSPTLDSAYFFPGPPPADATCKGSGGCWLFAGPSPTLNLSNGATYQYTSPNLPPGTYTVDWTGGYVNYADPPLHGIGSVYSYMKANGVASATNYDCKNTVSLYAENSCTVTLSGQGGYITLFAKGSTLTNAYNVATLAIHN